MNQYQKEIIANCQRSVTWFLTNFGKVKHPVAGSLPFVPFKYQRNAIKTFRQNRFVIFRKCRQCFAGDQPVWTPQGPRRIDSIQPGDLVYSLDYNDKLITSPVRQSINNGEADLYRLTTASGHFSVATADHEYLTEHGYIQANQLNVDHKIIEVADPITGQIGASNFVGLQRLHERGIVYDLNVGGSHNYIVNGAVVHNCGISKISGAYALWYAMFYPLKTVLIVSRTDIDAMQFLEDNIRYLFRNLPEWMQELWHPVKDNEHEIKFPNGSVIKSKTSHPDVMRSNTSSLNIIDEAAFIPNVGTMWSGAWSTLQAGGSAIIISTCVHPDTYVFTANGIAKIGDLAPKEFDAFDDGYFHSDYKGPAVLGIEGLEMPSKIYKRPKEATKKIRTKGGYEFEASLRHKLFVLNNDAVPAKTLVRDLKVGDYLPIKNGAMVFGDNDHLGYRHDDFTVDNFTPELGYILGVIVAEGHVRKTGVSVACGDDQVLNRIRSWNGLHWRTDKKRPYVIDCGSHKFAKFLRHIGMECTTAPYKKIPARLLSCSEPIIRAFLQGLFDGDRSSSKRDGEICLVSTSKELVNQVRALLFNYGIMCSTLPKAPGVTKFKNQDGSHRYHKTRKSYKLTISRHDTHKFYKMIGFGQQRKSGRQQPEKDWSVLMPPVIISLLKSLKDSTDLSIQKMADFGLAPNVLSGRKSITKNRLLRFLKNLGNTYASNVYYQRLVDLTRYDAFLEVVDLIDSESEVYDFTMPKTHTYIGDSAIHINTNGVGGWYWSTYTDAVLGENDFTPLDIMWWDMDWVVEYDDPLSGKHIRIAPRDGIRKCTTKEEIDKYGPYWSPWLETQWKGLQEKGEAWKFQQEVLASFVGSGNTVLDKSVLSFIETTVSDKFERLNTPQTYVHPGTGDQGVVDFTPPGIGQGLYIWERPVKGHPAKRQGDTIIDPGQEPYTYVAGLDLATGKGADYNAMVVLCVETGTQVAELMVHCKPRELKYMVDYICRYYNNALLVIERNNGGDNFIEEMRIELSYPNLWRKKSINNSGGRASVSYGEYGFYTGPAGKPLLNKHLIDNIRSNADEGFVIRSRRLYKQLQIYVRKRDQTGRDTDRTEAEPGAGNHDDLVIALGLALIGLPDAKQVDSAGMVPFKMPTDFASGPVDEEILKQAGPGLAYPIKLQLDKPLDLSIEEEMVRYMAQLGGFMGLDRMKLPPTKNKRKYF